ncbi:DUF4190 domain-containing protein [Microbacterium suaedae]|uniref:DUF4190 domain-containing protein n=1 Tax=Microbacterium suaedae TaxID=2067813 RepID=UPI000DA238C2|nr:DUF4190 domain-containing protein [Microbacterium suaedae]
MSDSNHPDDPNAQPPVPPAPSAGPESAAPQPPQEPQPAQEPQQPAAPATPGYEQPAPPYEQSGVPQPGYGYPGTAGSDPYGGAAYGSPGAPVPPPGAPPVPGAPQKSGKGLAIAALVLAIVGALLCFIPFAAFLGVVITVVALVLAIVALVKKAAGKGMSIAALIVSGIGTLIGIGMIFLTISIIAAFSSVSGDLDGFIEDNPELFDENPEFGSPEGGAEDGATESVPGLGAASADVEVTEQTLWSDDFLTYATVLVESGSDELVYPELEVTIDLLDDAGQILDTQYDIITVTPDGPALATANFIDIAIDEVAQLDVAVAETYGSDPIPASEFGAVSIGDVTREADEFTTALSGEVTSTTPEDRNYVEIDILFRDAGGDPIGLEWGVIETLPAGGTADFTIDSFLEIPNDATYEAYVQPGF